MSDFSAAADINPLNDLLAQLRAQQSKQPKLQSSHTYYSGANHGHEPSHGYQQASMSSPLPTPPTIGQQPHHHSAIMSPVPSPQPHAPAAMGAPSNNSDRTSSLLNLLKFQQGPAAAPSLVDVISSSPAQVATSIKHSLPSSREPSLNFGTQNPTGQVGASGYGHGGPDLLATLTANSLPGSSSVSTSQTATASKPAASSLKGPDARSPPAGTQAYLLSLLNKPTQKSRDPSPNLYFSKPAPQDSRTKEPLDEVDRLHSSTVDDSTGALPHPHDSNLAQSVAIHDRQNRSTVSSGIFNYVNPFEQLAASSPRPPAKSGVPKAQGLSGAPSIQILKREAPDNERRLDERNRYASPALTKRRIDVSSQASSGPPTPLPDGRTQLEALIGIGAQDRKDHIAKEAVSDALQDVGEIVNKEVQQAIARAEHEEQRAPLQKEIRNMFAATDEQKFQETAIETAIKINEELKKEENRDALADLPSPVAELVKDIIKDAAAQGLPAEGQVADSWESADAEDGAEKDQDKESIVKVFNFPLKPWSMIDIRESKEESRPPLRDEIILDIARLKKDFDQVDRQLVTASKDFIVYGMSKNGGIRIIRQDDGTDAKLFTKTQDRIYNVALSTSPVHMVDVIIGTGVSGTIYWTAIKDGEIDQLADGTPEMHGFALPPIPTQENESMGGVLKTRARKSANHPEFFAISRGKHIYVIWPSVILKQACFKNGKGRIVDTNKYLAKQSLRINTGKAGKDFTFSQDESTIVSLDKAGRIKFWDVQAFTQSQADSHDLPKLTRPMEITTPIMTITTTAPNEKAWPTSVLFIDKQRPYQRGGPLRYMIIGLKQNHTLQLWDLALKKPVQEVNLPHSNETDAVCSVLYHAASGMVVVGHPTRNSIYFIHLSAPKYAMPKSITQADYITKIASSARTESKVDATAVFSGVREYSFANKGALRSLDMLQSPSSDSESATIFEIYAMHSKGVTCLSIKQADLGWDCENNVIQPLDAVEARVITIQPLKELPTMLENGIDVPGPATPVPIYPRPAVEKDDVPKEILKKQNFDDPSAAKFDSMDESSIMATQLVAPSNTVERSDKSEKKKRRKINSILDPSISASTSGAASSIKHTATQTKRNLFETTTTKIESKNSASSTGDASHKPTIPDNDLVDLPKRLSRDVEQLLEKCFASLTNTIRDDRRTQAAVAEAKQDAILRLVSKTLSENIEATLGRIINLAIETSVVPSITGITSRTMLEAVKNRVNPSLDAHLAEIVPKEIQAILPGVIKKALQDPQLLKLMSESLSRSVSFKVEEQFANILQNTVLPAFKQLTITTSRHLAQDIERKATETIGTLERQRHSESVKIQNLTELVSRLSETVSSMAEAQTEFQSQFLKMQKPGENGAERITPLGASSALVEHSQEDKEYDEMLRLIQTAMDEGKYDHAVISWLQTRREQEFFRKYFVQYRPNFVQNLSPLLLLSLGASITNDFSDLSHERLDWVETILDCVGGRVHAGDLVGYLQVLRTMTSEPQLMPAQEEAAQDLIPKILQIYIQRLEHLFMRISNENAQDPSLKKVSALVSTATRIVNITADLARQMSQMF